MRRGLRALEPVFGRELRDGGVGVDGRPHAGPFEELAPAGNGVIPDVGGIAEGLDLVDEATELGLVRRVVVDEDEQPAGTQDACDLAERARRIAEVMRGQARGHDVHRSRGDRQRGRVGLDQKRVGHPGGREDAGARLEHFACRVHTDGAAKLRRDTPKGVTDAGADVHDALASVLRR